jgi:NTE family protein
VVLRVAGRTSESSSEIWLQSGAIEDAIRASIAFPGIFSPARIGDKWLVDGGLSNPVPVSVCWALGAEVTIAVNLNHDLLGRRFETKFDPGAAAEPARVPKEFVARLLHQLPAGLREQAEQIAPHLLTQGSSIPGYFDVLANSINIMQECVTRARLAGDPPHAIRIESSSVSYMAAAPGVGDGSGAKSSDNTPAPGGP